MAETQQAQDLNQLSPVPVPSGTTHFRTAGTSVAFYRESVSRWERWMDDRKGWMGIDLSFEVLAMVRPIAELVDALATLAQVGKSRSTWDGQGNPPVGVECIVTPHNTIWGFSSIDDVQCTVLGYYDELVWLKVPNPSETWPDARYFITTRTDKVYFRPIAISERDKAVEAMLALDVYPKGDAAGGLMSRKAFCEALFDAGWHKPEAQS